MREPYDPDRPPDDLIWIKDGEVHTGPIPGMTPEQARETNRLFDEAFHHIDVHNEGAAGAQHALLGFMLDQMSVEQRFAAALMTEAVRDANDGLFDDMAPGNPDWAGMMRTVREVMLTMNRLQREGAVDVLNATIRALRAID